MNDFNKEISSITIEQELKQSYLDYSMSVIVGRALPDVRDGLKPVHRRTLYAMQQLGNDSNKPYKKSARIVGEVIGKFHPHGESAVYDTIVRMAQDFSLRYMLVDGQGNFGSVDGDSAAAMRYTEIRLTRLAHSLMADLDKETVNFLPNYDETEHYPEVLPTRVPNLLVNGSAGIAVGMATNIPPHNLSEVIAACLALIEQPDLDVDALMVHLPGPDFPTAGIINGRAGIVQAYRTGRGRIVMRAKTTIETDETSGKQSLIVTELPYQVNKARLIEKIAYLVRDKRIEGISAIRDESDREGMRMVIEVRRHANAEVLLNNLYAQTQLQSVFGINMVALDGSQPKVMNLKHILHAFIGHRREVVTRRSLYELKKARDRAHILEGLGIALANIDVMIALIRAAANPAQAKAQLLARSWPPGIVKSLLDSVDFTVLRPAHLAPAYGMQDDGEYALSPVQVQAILDLKLHRLTGLEQEKILDEYRKLVDCIADLMAILSDAEQLMQVIRDELAEVAAQFADPRRTVIEASEMDLTTEDLIPEEDMVVTLSHEGYAKIQPLDLYQAQRRGGRGKMATSVKDTDFVEQILVANTHDMVLCFSNKGKVYWLKVYQIPQGGRTARGKPVVNLLPLMPEEKITAMLPVPSHLEDHFVIMATASGTIKKVALSAFSRPRSSGIIAIDLRDDDHLVGAALTNHAMDVMLFANSGKVVRFSQQAIRASGRSSIGVRGMRLTDDQRIISLVVVSGTDPILTVTTNGYGKRTAIDEFRCCGRGGSGVIGIQTNARNGELIGAAQVSADDELILIASRGTMVRTRINEISVIGRNTQGVRLVNVSEGEQLVGIQPVRELPLEEDADRQVAQVEQAVGLDAATGADQDQPDGVDVDTDQAS
jgi:DNA gyrase subunit A